MIQEKLVASKIEFKKYIPNKLWLDKFAFCKIGTLLNDSPKIIPILSSNDVHDNPSKLISNQLGNNQCKKPKSINKKN